MIELTSATRRGSYPRRVGAQTADTGAAQEPAGLVGTAYRPTRRTADLLDDLTTKLRSPRGTNESTRSEGFTFSRSAVTVRPTGERNSPQRKEPTAMIDFDSQTADDLDDFDSAEFEDVEDDDHTYLRGMWGSSSFGSTGDAAKDLIIAHGMVQSFVNAFARDGHYVVGFDESISTAGTDMKARRVVITPAPIADPKLTAEEAGLILTGLAVHEISHPRYGRNTSAAVEKVFPGNRVADRLSNLLDDIRIERRFVADYPGYAGVFTPTLEYVGNATTDGGRKLHTQSMSGLVNLAIAATRYPQFSTWTAETKAEAKWWTDWADRWSPEDAPKRHVEAIREALQHIADVKAAAKAPAPKPQPQMPKINVPQSSGSEDGDGGMQQNGADDGVPEDDDQPSTQGANSDADVDTSDEPGSDAPAASGDQPEGDTRGATDDEIAAGAGEPNIPSNPMSDEDLNEATRKDQDELRGDADPMHSVEGASRENGAEQRDINDLRREGEATLEAARNIEDDGHGNPVDVAKSLKGLTSGGLKLGPSLMASRYIRNAILRGRTGNTNVDQHQKRGRLDGSGLARIAYGDTRLFEKRVSPSPGKFNVYVMVDASGSMGWGNELAEAAQVAHAIASASQGTPTVRMSVFAWSDPFRNSPAWAGVAQVWTNGQSTDQIFRMSGLRTGGTPDAQCLSWGARSVRKNSRQNETPVVIFISDGQGDPNINERIAEARRAGVQVYGVSFGHGLDEKALIARYGKGNYVKFEGTITKTARPLADLFGRIVSGKEQR